MLKPKRWKKKELEEISSSIVGEPVTIYLTNLKWTNGYSALASEDPEECWIAFGYRVFNKTLIWHECSHLLFPETNPKATRSEIEFHCQVNAVNLALDRGEIDIARELIEDTLEWRKRPHKRAGEMVRQYFGVKS
jgi:hypothetical protein